MENAKEDGKVNIAEEPHEDKMTDEGSTPDAKAKFFSRIRKCTDFSTETLIEIQYICKGLQK